MKRINNMNLKQGFIIKKLLPIVMILVTMAGFTSIHFAHAGSDKTGLVIHDPWVREAPPNAPVLAAYMVVENTSDKAESILSVTSPQFVKCEIHMSGEKDGMAIMEKQDNVAVNPHKKIIFEPGGLHIMLIKPKKPLKAGDTVTLNMAIAGNSDISVTAKVVKKAALSKSHHMHNDHDKHGDHTH